MVESENNRALGGEERGMVSGEEEGERESKPGYRRRGYNGHTGEGETSRQLRYRNCTVGFPPSPDLSPDKR